MHSYPHKGPKPEEAEASAAKADKLQSLQFQFLFNHHSKMYSFCDQMLELSYNELRSIEGLEALQLLSCLNLSSNKVGSFIALEPLRKFKLLKVLDVSYNQIGEDSIDATRYLFSFPLSHSAGSEWNKDEILYNGTVATNY
ncbi:hypothetical protein SLE2022_114860 [Rubroshorea leprosula]